MKFEAIPESQTIYSRKPLKVAVPDMGDSQSRKNPFSKPVVSGTLPLQHKRTLFTSEEIGFLSSRSKTLCIAKSREPLKPSPTRVPMPSRIDTEPADDLCDWITEDESEEEKHCICESNVTLETESYLATLSKEVEYNFKIIRLLDLPSENEIEQHDIRLPKNSNKNIRNTLIVDLDETLIHTINSLYDYSAINISHKEFFTVVYRDNDEVSFNSIKVIVRPYALEFLKELSQLYEIVIFTASQKYYADAVLRLVDPNDEYISHRLYRGSCLQKDGRYLKDLRLFKNRDAKRMAIVDNSIVAFAASLENGIHIATYYGQESDSCLKQTMELLKQIAHCENMQTELAKKVGLLKLYKKYLNSDC